VLLLLLFTKTARTSCTYSLLAMVNLPFEASHQLTCVGLDVVCFVFRNLLHGVLNSNIITALSRIRFSVARGNEDFSD
jgi:hypothetical protein